MTQFKTQLNLVDPDGFYAALIKLHEGLSEQESHRLNAKLILMLANQIGERAVLFEILNRVQTARSTPAAPGEV